MHLKCGCGVQGGERERRLRMGLGGSVSMGGERVARGRSEVRADSFVLLWVVELFVWRCDFLVEGVFVGKVSS